MKSPKFALLWERNPERNLYKSPFGAPSSCTIGMKLIQLPVDPLFCETNGTFLIQPFKKLYWDRDEVSINHCRVRTKNFSRIALCSCAKLFILTVPRFILEFNGYLRTDRTTWRNAVPANWQNNLTKCWARGWVGGGGEEHVTDEHSGQGENCNTSCHFTLQKQEYPVAG